MVMKNIVFLMAVAAVTLYLIRQCRKPHSWVGRFFLWEMSTRHKDLADWGLSHVVIKSDFQILDVGCGAGKTVANLAEMAANGSVSGLDYSRASVGASLRTNRDAVARGHIAIYHGSVSNLPFQDRHFDVVTAVETHYYWPNLITDLREIRRVLKPGGKVLIIAEAFKRSRWDPTHLVMKLVSAGYDDIEILTDRSKGWLCAIGVNKNGSDVGEIGPRADPLTTN
jgi:SAM-dependent methyltransferase